MPRRASPRLPAGCGGESFPRGREASPCCGARAAEAPQRSGVIMLAEVRALPRPAGCGRGGSGSPSARAAGCAPRPAEGRRLCPPPGPPTCRGSRGSLPPWPGRAARPGQHRAPLITPPSSLGRALFPRRGPAGQGGTGGGTLRAPRRSLARRACSVRQPAGAGPPSAGGRAFPLGEGPRDRSSAADPVSEEAQLVRRGPASALGLVGEMSPPGPRTLAPTSASPGLLLCGSFVKAPELAFFLKRLKPNGFAVAGVCGCR